MSEATTPTKDVVDAGLRWNECITLCTHKEVHKEQRQWSCVRCTNTEVIAVRLWTCRMLKMRAINLTSKYMYKKLMRRVSVSVNLTEDRLLSVVKTCKLNKVLQKKLVTKLNVNRDCMVNSIFKLSKTWHLVTLFNVHSVLYFLYQFHWIPSISCILCHEISFCNEVLLLNKEH